MNAKLDPKACPWMSEPAVGAVMRALDADGGWARFVGGAVRNALLGMALDDVDIATPLTPDEVMRRLKDAGLGAVPTGIEHGTITAVSIGKTFEVTTLRRDVQTDGRRAVVAFTQDWREDAMRRDFTINALYASQDGAVYDYFGGLEDLAACHVRFVGDAVVRIREDYLRILRLFRFHAWYGKGELDAEALSASVREKAGLKRLSGERVQKELLRLLQAKEPSASLRVMQDAGILSELLPAGLQMTRLERLIAIENANAMAPDALLRLAALLPDRIPAARNVAGLLRLSNVARNRLIDAAEKDGRIVSSLDATGARQMMYRLSTDRFRDCVLLQWAASKVDVQDPSWHNLLALVQDWKVPIFPLDGNDVMALGFEEGPEIGVLLGKVESWWVENDFLPNRLQLFERLKDAAKRPRG